jgi:hypothetical protein
VFYQERLPTEDDTAYCRALPGKPFRNRSGFVVDSALLGNEGVKNEKGALKEDAND